TPRAWGRRGQSYLITEQNIKIKAGTKLKNNRPHTEEFSFRVAADVPYSHPYWLREKGTPGFYAIPHPRLTGEALSPTPLAAQVTLKADDQELVFNAPIFYRRRDPAAGEKIRSLEIAPRVTINFLEKVFYFAENSPKKIPVKIQGGPAPVSGKITFNVDAGWQVEPRTLSFDLKKEFAGQDAVIVITPPKQNSTCHLTVDVSDGRVEKGRSRVEIDYPHVPRQNLFPLAGAKLVRVDLKKRGGRAAYIMGSGDEIPRYLTQVGYEVKILSDEDLQQEDLSVYDAVILGIRAYNTRSILKYSQQRLLDYVSRGGNLVLQYNVSRGLQVEQIGPYPLELSRAARVTDELAAVTLLEPAHPIFNSPNKIRAADFENWVQERGLYFAGKWDPRYKALLSCFDKGEEPKRGGLLAAEYGKGNFIYSGYSWFRQLPAGVPGALKLFVNMISLENRW
ncbi:MAG: LmbE family protein, partial [Candidatus Aminicenantes bacterium]|nr:LmbE family protein [Candidatus Aminicenantes bacterium]